MITKIAPIRNFFVQLVQTSSTNGKKEFIKNNATDDIKEVLQWLYDTSVVTGISDGKYDKAVFIDTPPYKTFKELTLYLSKRHTGTDYDLAVVKATANELCDCEEDYTFYKSLITKTVKVGIDSKLINSVFPNLSSRAGILGYLYPR